jgi:hypothetical protein
MPLTQDWHLIRDKWIRLLENQTSESLHIWHRRICEASIGDEAGLRTWLCARGVTGRAQSLLVMERFGYTDCKLAAADELIEKQYEHRPHLRPIYDAIISSATGCGKLVIQVRETYVSLVAPRRTFARVQPRRLQLDLGLRLENFKEGGRLEASRIHHTMRVQIALNTRNEVDDEVHQWLKQAYVENS